MALQDLILKVFQNRSLTDLIDWFLIDLWKNFGSPIHDWDLHIPTLYFRRCITGVSLIPRGFYKPNTIGRFWFLYIRWLEVARDNFWLLRRPLAFSQGIFAGTKRGRPTGDFSIFVCPSVHLSSICSVVSFSTNIPHTPIIFYRFWTPSKMNIRGHIAGPRPPLPSI